MPPLAPGERKNGGNLFQPVADGRILKIGLQRRHDFLRLAAAWNAPAYLEVAGPIL